MINIKCFLFFCFNFIIFLTFVFFFNLFLRLKHEKKKSEHASNLDQGIYKILSYHELNNIPDMGIPACLLRRKEDVFGTDFDYINE